ncbi:V-type ATP synthase subunit E, partial [Methanoculleus sp.]|nr:V-type ATP synthase subunit E [Methanoculleus sp.]
EFHEKALTDLLKRAAKEIKKGTVHTNERDIPVAEGIISRLKTLSGYAVGDPVEIPGGIIVESIDGELQLDFSYSTFLDEIWESALKDASDILFT